MSTASGFFFISVLFTFDFLSTIVNLTASINWTGITDKMYELHCSLAAVL